MPSVLFRAGHSEQLNFINRKRSGFFKGMITMQKKKKDSASQHSRSLVPIMFKSMKFRQSTRVRIQDLLSLFITPAKL